MKTGQSERLDSSTPKPGLLGWPFQHVPKPNLMVMRHWGLSSPTKAEDRKRD
jgi:hypothetical protein